LRQMKKNMLTRVSSLLGSNSRGVGMVEVLIALALLGLVAAAFLNGLSTSLNAVVISDEGSTAIALAQGQMEYVKSQEYSDVAGWSYTVTTSPPSYSTDPQWAEDPTPLSSDYSGYCIRAESEQVDGTTSEDEGIRKITVTVYHNESCTGDAVFTLKDYKVKL